MRPMQFPRRFPWLIALVLLPFSGVLFLPLGLWYWMAYPPVQHYYLGAYFEGAFVDDHSTVAVPVQWTPLANSLLHSHNAAMITLPKMMTRLKIPRNPLT